MVPRCSVCTHASHFEINRNLLAGVPYRALAAQFSLSPSALCRHAKHIARERQTLLRQRDRDYQDSIMEKLELLNHRLDRLFTSAHDLRSLNVSLGCIRESLRLISLLDRFRLGHGGQP
jgi:hypothetical protein